jgi:hypothetical protein
MRSRSPFPVICLTCRHLVLRFFRVAAWIDYYPECALRLPHGGRAITCGSYEREPGSDDEPIRMARNPTPDGGPWHSVPMVPRVPAPEGSARYPLRGRGNAAARWIAERDGKQAARPGRWRIVGVAT